MPRELFVGNLAFSMTDDALKGIFAEVGEVESAKVIMDRMSGRSKGFGFVTMKTEEQAAAAIEKINNRAYQERPLRVNYSDSNEQRASKPRTPGGGYGGGHGGGGYGGGNGGGYGGGNGGGSSPRKSFGGPRS